ncbi:GntR family transcriptional regulator [uncultured Friedmanniella sp.]|uniref:GntR family transcriptional regulator n=1 Tax=uncultured Friedmanniella sp. TaxID=335381 RepID=UPI0035C97E67
MTSLPLTLDPGAAVPMSEQLSTQLVALVESGTLAAGARLPAVRALAAELGVAPGTVAKVYRGLEQEGFLTTAGRLGTVVADLHPGATEQTRRAIRAAVQPLLDQGLSPAAVLRLVRSVLEE